MKKTVSLNKIYKLLLKKHGKQLWWPIIDTKTSISNYNGNNIENEIESFEIAIGAILTQSVSWKNVEKALINLKLKNYLHPEALYNQTIKNIAALIKPSGYYNQKAKKIKNFLDWFKDYKFSFSNLKNVDLNKLRNELLMINGIGPETADSIILYAFSKKIFVVDEYTKRIFKRAGLLSGNEKYEEIQGIFHENFKGEISDYNEYHALIVAHGKDICKYSIKSGKKPLCEVCNIERYCSKNFKQ